MEPRYQIRLPIDAIMADHRLRAASGATILLDELAGATLANGEADGAHHQVWHPAVLRLAGVVGATGRDYGKPVRVATTDADPLLATVLAGLGATEACTLGPTDLELAQAAAAAALAAPDAAAARAAAAAVVERQ